MSNGTHPPSPPPPGHDPGVSALCEAHGHQWGGNVCVRCGRVVKPCSKRMRSTTGRAMWCVLPDDHASDCHGITGAEMEPNDYGPNRKRLESKR